MRDYGKVHTKFWADPSIMYLSDDAKIIALYLLTGPHTNALGCFRVPLGYVASDLCWNSFERVKEGFEELSKAGFIKIGKFDWVLLPKFLRYNSPENQNVGVMVSKLVEQVPEFSGILGDLANCVISYPKHLPSELIQDMKGLTTLSEGYAKPFPTESQIPEPEPEPEPEPYTPLTPQGGNLSEANPSASDDGNTLASTLATAPERTKPNKRQSESNKHDDTARQVLGYLNTSCNRSFKATDGHLKHIRGRLAEGFTLDELKLVVDHQRKEWAGTDMERYWRPSTLFNSEKCDGYLQAAKSKPMQSATSRLSKTGQATAEAAQRVYERLKAQEAAEQQQGATS